MCKDTLKYCRTKIKNEEQKTNYAIFFMCHTVRGIIIFCDKKTWKIFGFHKKWVL